MISLDPLHHRVSIGAQTVTLQPLSFALFAKLHERRNEIVSLKELNDEVWSDVTVSPETLKQRIFLLRKALDDAGVEGCTVQSVRGRGYRLLVTDESRPENSVTGRSRLIWTIAGATLALLMAVYIWQSRQAYELPANNRVVFWSTSALQAPDDSWVDWEQRWTSRLSSGGGMTFIAIQRDTEQTITQQARSSRAALVSQWTLFVDGGEPWVTAQLLEPKTASILASDQAALNDEQQMSAMLDRQIAVVRRVVDSGILPISGDALVDTDHPAWDELRRLAADPD